MIGSPNPVWPLKRDPKTPSKTGSFGAARPSSKNPTRHHQGIDLYAEIGEAVYAMEDGVIVASQGWDGPNAKAILVESVDTGILILYGAVAPGSWPAKGTKVKRGQKIAEIGVYSGGSHMLHAECWLPGVRPPRTRWNWGEAQPSNNLDPWPYFQRAMGVDPGELDDVVDDDQGDVQDPPPPPAKGGGGGGLLVAAAALVGGVILMR